MDLAYSQYTFLGTEAFLQLLAVLFFERRDLSINMSLMRNLILISREELSKSVKFLHKKYYFQGLRVEFNY